MNAYEILKDKLYQARVEGSNFVELTYHTAKQIREQLELLENIYNNLKFYFGEKVENEYNRSARHF